MHFYCSICNSYQREHCTDEGNFRPILRMYQPRPEALDGTCVLRLFAGRNEAS
jgi:hypothetical protein